MRVLSVFSFNIFHQMLNCSFHKCLKFDVQSQHARMYTLMQTLFHSDMCLNALYLSVSFCPFDTDLQHFPHWEKKQNTYSGFWEGSALKPQEDHTLAENCSIAIIRMNSVWPFAVLSGRGTQLDLTAGELSALGDSQFSYSFPLLAAVILTQLATDRNICSEL